MGLNRRVAGAALLVAAVVAVAGCDDGTGDADATSIVPPTPVATSPPTEPPTTTAIPTSTAAPTTEPPATPTTAAPTTAPPTTVPPSTTIDEEAVKAQIAADIEAADERLNTLFRDPAQPNAASQLPLLGAPGPYLELLNSRLQQLIRDGQRLVPGVPPIHHLTVEAVTLTGPGTATVVYCRVDNTSVVQRRPDGTDIVVVPASLVAIRDAEEVALTSNGWLLSSIDRTFTGVFEGQEQCGS